jgi:diaminohydroxyphosphoribosylaminopyrimidine deaminase / 5-amino-6-(5-phosphoribosylamino)uracil reductase
MDEAGFMWRAINLARQGRGRVEPNPMVGCVLVRDGQIIGEGWHEYFGGPHAEPNALAKCPKPEGAAAYVTLEPCCHTNKKTPPCVPALIKAGLSRVVAACEDENPLIAGRGMQALRAAGIKAEVGLLQAESRQMNAAYSKLVTHHRPYVTLKWAQTADGKVAGTGGKRLAISGEKSLAAVQRLRSLCDAILVGIGTVLADDPLLTARVPDPARQPVRIVLDSELRIDAQSALVKSIASAPVWVFCSEATLSKKPDAVAALRSHGVVVNSLPSERMGNLSLAALLDELGKKKFTHLLVEPGPTLARSFIDSNLADRVWIFRSPIRADAADAPAAVHIDYPVAAKISLDGDELREYLNPAGEAFYLLQKSANFVFAE